MSRPQNNQRDNQEVMNRVNTAYDQNKKGLRKSESRHSEFKAKRSL